MDTIPAQGTATISTSSVTVLQMRNLDGRGLGGKRVAWYIRNTTAAGGASMSLGDGKDAVYGSGLMIAPGEFVIDSQSAEYLPSQNQINVISTGAGGTISYYERVV